MTICSVFNSATVKRKQTMSVCIMSIISFTLLTIVPLFSNPVYGNSGAFYADNGREQSILYRTLAKKDKTELREEILNLLGLDRRPRKRSFSKHKNFEVHKSSAEKYLLDVYKTLDNDEDRSNICRKNNTCMNLLSNSDLIVSFPNKIHQYSHLRHESDRRFYFDVSKIPSEEIVTAELRIFRNITKRSQMNKKYRYALSLYDISENNGANILELVDELVITGTDTGIWLVLNVTIPVMKWIAFPKRNLGLYLKIKSMIKFQDRVHSIDPHEIGILSSRAPDEYKAFMVAYFKSSNHVRIRTKRAARKRQQDSYYDQDGYNPYRLPRDRYSIKKRSCERWALYVSFRDLGFEDWIIAPDGYAAFYCDGSCTFPLNAQMNATNHAIVQTLMHLMDPTAVPKPCCAPTQLTAITVLYFDDNSNVILKRYKNMVVKSCGCH